MINFNFNIRVPGSNRFRSIRCWAGSLPMPFKFWELQIYFSADVIDIGIDITARQSHSGIRLCLGLLGVTVEFTIYDSRHWSEGKWHSQS
jgi:hypothetical protein